MSFGCLWQISQGRMAQAAMSHFGGLWRWLKIRNTNVILRAPCAHVGGDCGACGSGAIGASG
jgi:hypothetical protein